MRSIQDEIYSSKLTGISRKALLDAFSTAKDVEHPLGQLWEDASTGLTWSPHGRLGWLWLTMPGNVSPSNFATATELLKEANICDNAWHETFNGTPDILLLWLGHLRSSSLHSQLEQRLSGVLHCNDAAFPMGAGLENDGGWLDKAFAWLHSSLLATPDPSGNKVDQHGAEMIYSRLLRCNLSGLENSYGVWGKPTHMNWCSTNAKVVFDRLVLNMDDVGLDPVSILSSYMLLSGCEQHFLKEPSEDILKLAPNWMSRMVEQALEDPSKPYRFPSTLVQKMISWPGVGFPECLKQLEGLPETMSYIRQTTPQLADTIEASQSVLVIQSSNSVKRSPLRM